ncbi:MAG: hypothetical protein DME88_08895 [Verrucomicrobia bacterium]|nr:MAG: hypothetical protein DME88_08895 [Verrucomicrobiota bacterium]
MWHAPGRRRVRRIRSRFCVSGKPIPHARLEAIPFARFTVECQSQLEKQSKASRVRHSVTSLFGLTDEEGGETEEEEAAPTEVKE